MNSLSGVTRLSALLLLLAAGGCTVTDLQPTPRTDGDFLPAVSLTSAPLPVSQAVTRVALGSCFDPVEPGGIFDTIRAEAPDLFVFLGDNVYAADESDDPALMSLRRAYADLARVPALTRLREQVPVLSIWDDHDYGRNDAGSDFAARDFSERLFEYVWSVDPGDPSAGRPGIYFEKSLGPPGRRLQIIGLDTRFFRSALTVNPDPATGRYLPSKDPAQDLLGADQWRWLEAQLRRPADVRLLLTSIQLIADGHRWEAWAMMPKERARLYRLIEEVQPNGLVVVSGDRHSAALYRLDNMTPYPLHEMTTSSLNLPLSGWVPDPVDEPGPHRLTQPYYESNYGIIDIDWQAGTVALILRGRHGETISEVTLALDDLEAQGRQQQ